MKERERGGSDGGRPSLAAVSLSLGSSYSYTGRKERSQQRSCFRDVHQAVEVSVCQRGG